MLAAHYPNIDHVRVANDDAGMLDVLQQVEMSLECPSLSPIQSIPHEAIGRMARERRLSIMLSGLMGNATISYDGGAMLAAQVPQVRSGRRPRAPCSPPRAAAPRRWLGLLGEVADTVLPQPLPQALRRAAGKRGANLAPSYSPIRRTFAKAMGVHGARRGAQRQPEQSAPGGDSRALRVAMFDRIDQRSYAASATAATLRRRPARPHRRSPADRALPVDP